MFLFGWRKQLKEVLNHIGTINDELGKVQRDVGWLKRDVGWLKWLVGGTFLAALADLLKDLRS